MFPWSTNILELFPIILVCISFVYVCVRAQEDVEFEVKVLKVDKSNGVASVDGRNKKSGKAALQGRVTMSFEPTSKL